MKKTIFKHTRRALTLLLFMFLVCTLSFPVYARSGSGTLDISGLTGHENSGLAVSFEWKDALSNANGAGSISGDAYGSATLKGQTIVLSAKGYDGRLSFDYVTVLTVTITNTSSVDKTLSFDISKGTIAGGLKIDGADAGASYSCTLQKNSGNSCKIVLTTAANNTVNSATLSNIKLTPPKAIRKITFLNSPDGKGTIDLADGTPREYEEAITGLKPVATDPTNYEFKAWVDQNGNQISYSSSGFALPDTDITVYPLFAPKNSGEYRLLGSTYRYYYWEDAFDAAQAKGITTVIMTENATLSSDAGLVKVGDHAKLENGVYQYIIPSGYKLLIPYSADDIANGGTFASGDSFQNDSTATPTTYRTMTVASGAQIICNGQMNVNGQRTELAQPHSGRAAGGHGLVKLEGGETQLIVNGTLYCYGFVSGTGQVVVNGTMHELFQMAAWPGGTNAAGWISATGDIKSDSQLFLTNYYVQNVEAPLRVNGTATVYVETVVKVTFAGFPIEQRKNCAFIVPSTSSSGLFLMDPNSYITRTYDKTTDRVTYGIYAEEGKKANVKFGSIILKVETGISGSATIDSKEYILPVTPAMTVDIGDDITMDFANRVSLLPGSEVNVHEGATVNLSNRMFIFDIDDWKTEMAFSGIAVPQNYTIGRGTTKKLTITKSAWLEVDGTLNVTSGGGIYVTNGHNITGSVTTSDIGKILHGTGIINHTAAQSATATLKVGYSGTLYDMSVGAAVGRLAGVTFADESGNLAYDPFTFTVTTAEDTNSFYGLGEDYNHYWYQHVIMVANGAEGVIPAGNSVGEANGYANGVRSNTTNSVASNNNVVGYAADGGSFSFKAPDNLCKVLVDGAELAPDSNGVYTITNITADRTITMVEHSWDEGKVTTEPTCKDKGVITFTCQNNNTHTKTEDGDPATGIHTDTNGDLVCSGCQSKLFKLLTMNVAADARTELVLKFEVHKDLYDAAEADEKQAYENVVLVNFDNSKDTNATHTIDLEEETTDAGTKYYVIVTQPVASGLMTENVTVTFSDGDNSVYVLGTGDSSVSRNVVDYARAVLLSEGTSDAAKKLVAAMVNYGGYAQQFFALKNSTEPGTLASDLLSETGINAPEISAEKSLTSIDGTLVSGDLTVTQDPGLDAAISQRIFFALSNGASFTSESTTQVSVTLTYKRTRNGEEYTKTLYPKQENDGRYSVEILNIPAAFLDFGYKIEGVYYNSNGEEKTFVVYPSIASYMSRVYKNEGFTTTNKSDDADLAEARKNLMEAMWLYNQAAYDFFYPSNESEGS